MIIIFKKIFVICFLIFIHLIINAQNKITGKITDEKTGEAIPGATVYIPELKTGDLADINGVYEIDNLPRVQVIVQVSFLGYKSIVEKVDLATTSSKNFVMEQAITEMNEVVVTGTSRTTEITRNPVPMITLGRKELQQNLSTNIIDAISKLPGVSAVTTGPNVSKPFIHGLGYNRVLTLFDGVRQEGQQWGDEHGVEVDENAVDNIEVVKGPASLTYGSDALAGVVNLLSAPPVPDSTIKGHVETNYQTNNGLIAAHADIAGNKRGFIWGVVASYKLASNYQNKYDGKVYGTGFKESDISGYVGLNKHWGYSHLNFSLFNDLQEIPDGSRDSVTRKFTKQITEADIFRPIVSGPELNSYKINVLHQHVQHYRLYSSNNFIIGKGKLGLILGYQQSIRREYSHPEYPDLPGMYIDLKTFTYDVKYSIPESKGWETTFGINGMYQRNTNKGTEFIIPDYHQFDIGPFILATKTIDKLDLSAGVRYDTRTFKFQQAKAQLYGWEVNLDVHPFDWLHFENSISVIYALNKGGNGTQVSDSSKYLPFIPPLHTNTELRANISSKSKHISSFYFKIGMEYYARQNRIYSANNTETPTPGYILYNAGIGADVMNSKGKVLLSINISGNNITDIAYQSHLSRLKYFEEYPNNSTGRTGIYNMGRNISFKVTIPLNF